MELWLIFHLRNIKCTIYINTPQ